MPKTNKRYQLLDNLDFQNPIAIEDQADIKFNLFLRSREMKQVVAYLEKIMLKKRADQDLFVSENKASIESLMKIFVDNSNLSLEGMQLDQESAELSMQLATDLRKSISLINALFYGIDGLSS